MSIAEGTSVSYSMSLSCRPSSIVTVRALADASAPLQLTPTVVVFSPANFSVGASVSVYAVEDRVAWPLGNVFQISPGVVSGDARFNGASVDAVNVSVIDNDFAAVLSSGGSVSLVEGGARWRVWRWQCEICGCSVIREQC